ncbi:MAG: hypothetical protein BKPUNTRY_001298, partial [Candidatus Fervidibacter sp.]
MSAAISFSPPTHQDAQCLELKGEQANTPVTYFNAQTPMPLS